MPLPCEKILAGSQTGKPAFRPGSVVGHVIEAFMFKNPCFPRPEIIAFRRPVSVFKNEPVILRCHSQRGGVSAVPIRKTIHA